VAITPPQVEEACGTIERSLGAFRADPRDTAPLLHAVETQQWLRDQYRDNRAVLDPFADRLRDLGQAISESIRSARQALTEAYLRATEAANAWDRRRRVCRDALADLARTDGIERFESPLGWIDVHHIRSVTLPSAGTPERDELGALIRETGKWEAVTQPNGRKLAKALDEGLFSPEQAARLAALCTIETVCRLTGHSHDR